MRCSKLVAQLQIALTDFVAAASLSQEVHLQSLFKEKQKKHLVQRFQLKDLLPLLLLQTSEFSVLDGEIFSTGGSFCGLLEEFLRGGTGLMLWVIANEMGRSLSRMFSCRTGSKTDQECLAEKT